MTKSSYPLIGAHVSIAGGIHRAIDTGIELGCTAIQIFTHSNRQWSFKPIQQEAADLFIKEQKNSPIEMVVAHATYLMNLASPNSASRLKAILMLEMELQACEILKIPYLVIHPGSHLESDMKDALYNCAQSINVALDNDGATKILIENMAGQGSVIGSSLEQLSEIYRQIHHKDRVGFCFDTCHAFAAGYDFTTSTTYENFWKHFDSVLGIEKLHCIHMNDSIKPLNARVDRHTNIGEGKIGLEAFSLLMSDEQLKHIPKILETPKGDELENDRINIRLLKSLIKKQ